MLNFSYLLQLLSNKVETMFEQVGNLHLPADWKTYHAEIKDRCINLITYKIWNGIDTLKFNSWIKNFQTEEEKYLCACILDSLMYRSNSMIKSLIYHLFNVVLPNYTRQNPTPIGEVSDWLVRLKYDEEPGVRLVAVLGEHDAPMKSSSFILRLLCKEFAINKSWIVSPDKIGYCQKSGIKTFIFIDDFLGSGRQFEDLILEYGLHRLSDSYVLYCPLVAHEDGISFMNENYGTIPIICSEFLSSKLNFFELYFGQNPDGAREFYKRMLIKRGINLAEGEEFGFGNLQIAYAFEDSSPDNALNVLWLNTTGWSPLFGR